ncbi:hypothetical protein BC937DRAFT_87180 [Endogone sp. FLAS-F59071]|nr:hypothetical protein BC937DRAFT_87180 [Endogone sp. FLAS-F59071]|eukprot:RUS19630.1 hypothetical protein BC937DRAFT_87180 [Endogone sp. FLAS-F59071]
MSTQRDVYKHIQERIQDYHLTPQEISALYKARGQLQTHMITGSFAGAVGGFALIRRGRLTRIQSALVCASALFFGSQIGMVTGALAGMRTIQALPEPGRLMGLIREVRSEIIAKNYKRDTPKFPQPAEQERRREQAGWKQQQQSQPQGNGGEGEGFASDDAAMLGDREARLGMGTEFEKDNDFRRSPPQSSTATTTTSDTEPGAATTNPPTTFTNPPTTWSQIRAAKLPNQSPTWAKIRERAASGAPPPPVESTEEKYAGLSSSPSAFDGRAEEPIRELPRTREEQAARGTRRVNKYGDPIE